MWKWEERGERRQNSLIIDLTSPIIMCSKNPQQLKGSNFYSPLQQFCHYSTLSNHPGVLQLENPVCPTSINLPPPPSQPSRTLVNSTHQRGCACYSSPALYGHYRDKRRCLSLDRAWPGLIRPFSTPSFGRTSKKLEHLQYLSSSNE
ncbi:hypothetical protein OWV82_016946 [Melia azedarach]|uniref:Uncharacterized protein n=1 Tax=Melia azedarach TaxID=155640 RepID=A0ACC1XI66_MELAZ|nr:hypothetical protein OWV82_016946 [Melia azedarach]